MTLPNFLIIGAQKAGSTWLAENLRQHPSVYMPEGELHFFDKDHNFRRGLAWYEAHFEAAADRPAVGEKTPDYLWADGRGAEGHLPDVHRHIAAALPEVRLIAVLRDPVERAISAVNHLYATGRISPLHGIDDYLLGPRRDEVAGHGVIEYCFYHRQLSAYLELFPRRQLLVLIYEEDVIASPRLGLRQVCGFLGIDPEFPFGELERRVNERVFSRPGLALRYYAPSAGRLARQLDRVFPRVKLRPSDATRRALHEIYRDENRRLFELLGRRPAAWLGRDAPADVGSAG